MESATTSKVDSRQFSPDIERALPILILIATFVVIYFSTWNALFEGWITDARYSHGPLLIGVSLALIIRQGLAVSSDAPASTGFAPAALIIMTGAVWLSAYQTNILVIQGLTIPLLFLFALWGLFGWPVAKKFWFSLGLIYFTVPIWDVLTPFLQKMTTEVSAGLTRLAGIPTFIDDPIVFLPAGNFEIEAGCSGLNFFIVSCAIGSIFAYLRLNSLRNRILFVVIAVAFGILANWIRVVIIVFAGQLSDMQHYLVTVDHYKFGWVVYAMMLLPLIVVARKLVNNDEALPARTDELVETRKRLGASFRRWVFYLMLIVLPQGFAWGLQLKEQAYIDAEVNLPRNIGSWEEVRLTQISWRPQFYGAHDEVLARYRSGSEEIDVYAVLYLLQDQGNELVNQNNRLQDRDDWKLIETRNLDISDREPELAYLNVRLSQHKLGMKVAILYWYVVGDLRTSRPLSAKHMELKENLAGRIGSGLIAVKADCRTSSCAGALKVLEEIASNHLDDLSVSVILE
jgi:exosortase A